MKKNKHKEKPKVLKALGFSFLCVWVYITLDEEIKGEGLFMSFVLIAVGAFYIWGMWSIFYGKDKF